MTWNEIDKQTHDNGKSSNHFVKIENFTKKAKDRFNELNLDEFSDNVYSIRLKNKERLYGILIDGVFFILWYDINHTVYDYKLKHT